MFTSSATLAAKASRGGMTRRVVFGLAAATIGLGVAAVPTVARTQTGSPEPVAGAGRSSGCSGAGKRLGNSRASRTTARRAMLCLLNATRRAHGLGRLRRNAHLRGAAERHSQSMVEGRYFAHIEPDGLSPLDRILATGYLTGANGYTYGENLGFGQGARSSPRRMRRAWMGSAPHRANILAGRFRDVGIGVAAGIPGLAGARGGTYTADFGVRHRASGSQDSPTDP